jgi:hypothetical protein
MLESEDRVNPVLSFGFQFWVIEQVGERNDPIEPVRAALPTFGVPANPLAVGDIGPELIKMSAQAIGLNLKLLFQPSRRANVPERQRAKRFVKECGERGRPFSVMRNHADSFPVSLR